MADILELFNVEPSRGMYSPLYWRVAAKGSCTGPVTVGPTKV